MSLDYLFLYEHSVREYESLLLLCREMEKRGYSCEIRQLLDRKKLKYFTWKKPEVLVSSNMYDNEAINSHVYNNVGRLNKVVNLHWEQVLSDTQEDEPWFNFNGNAKKCVQTCWGSATSRRLIAHGMEEKNTPVTGAVMMDFFRPEFKGYFEDKKELCARHSLDGDKPLWLYISSFGYASMEADEVEEISKMAGTDFHEFARVNRESMAQTLDWFDRWLAENPDVQLVYRRHPSEWNSPALDALAKKRPNFFVIFEDSVKQWIKAADNIFIWMSTAIAEVYFANKSCSILRPMHIPHEFDPVIYKDGEYITNYVSFAKYADLALSGSIDKTDFPIPPEIIESYFDYSEKPAYIRMADLLEDIYKNPPRDIIFDENFKPRFNFLKFFALWGIHIFHWLRFNPRRLKFAPSFADFAGRIYGYVDKAYVPKMQKEKMRKRIDDALNSD